MRGETKKQEEVKNENDNEEEKNEKEEWKKLKWKEKKVKLMTFITSKKMTEIKQKGPVAVCGGRAQAPL